MKKALITILLMFFYFLLNAQSNFKNGYVVTLSGDSIHGSIKVQNDVQNSEKCIFKDESDQIKIYKPGDIAAYRFENGRYYVSGFAEQKNVVRRIFAENLVKGKKSLFYFRDQAGYHYLLSYHGDTLIEIPFRKRNIYVSGVGYYEGPPLQTGFLRAYFKDEPSLYKDIDKIQQLNFNSLISLIEKYNQLVCGNNCYTNNYKVPSVKMAIELQGGIEHVKFGLSRYRYLPQAGGLLFLRIPRADNRLAIKTGLLYYGYPGNTNYPVFPRFSIYTVPLQFEYVFSRDRVVNPKCDFGFDYIMTYYRGYSGNGKALALAGSAGVLFKISRSADFDVSLDSDIFSLRLDTAFFYAYSLNGGIYFKF